MTTIATQPQGMPVPTPAARPVRRAVPRRLRRGFSGRVVLTLAVLTATYDKSGIVVGATSVSIYKVLLFGLLAFYGADRLLGRRVKAKRLNRHVYRVIIGFVVLQTLASVAGEFVTQMPMAWSSEVYYLIQRASVLLIPILAIHFRVSPRRVYRLFVGAVLIHFAFIGFQFASPSAFSHFGHMVSDGVRLDHTLDWAGNSMDFIGLQRTSNYGTFAAAFGVLALGFTPRRSVGRILRFLCVGAALACVVLGPSRASLVMVAVALVVWAIRTGWFRRASTYLKVAAVAMAVGVAVVALGRIPTDRFASYNAFFDPDRQGSTDGKVAIAEMGLELFSQSPVVGYGERRFADLSQQWRNTNDFESEAHSFGLSTLVSSGLVGIVAYAWLWCVIVAALWRTPDRDYAILCSLFIGLGCYNVVYDAGGLDLFAAFNGLAAYYALTAPGPRRHRRPRAEASVPASEPRV
jgi:O-antigen ligase